MVYAGARRLRLSRIDDDKALRRRSLIRLSTALLNCYFIGLNENTKITNGYLFFVFIVNKSRILLLVLLTTTTTTIKKKHIKTLMRVRMCIRRQIWSTRTRVAISINLNKWRDNCARCSVKKKWCITKS